jgi:hypothetical protein
VHLELLLAFFAGIGIAAASGLRAFLPLLALGLAQRFGVIELRSDSAWLAMNPVLVSLAVATVVELLADKIPIVDHALDVIATFLRPAAAWLGAFAILGGWPAPLRLLAATLLGGGALAIHALRAKLRLGSTSLTLGHANPLISIAEDAVAIGLLLAALFVPLILIPLVFLAVRALMARSRAPRGAATRDLE